VRWYRHHVVASYQPGNVDPLPSTALFDALAAATANFQWYRQPVAWYATDVANQVQAADFSVAATALRFNSHGKPPSTRLGAVLLQVHCLYCISTGATWRALVKHHTPKGGGF